MNSSSRPAGKFSVWELCALALMGALIFAVKAALAAIPNVQLNALLIILTVIFFGWKALAAVGIYVLLEGLIFGFGVWWVSYVFIWPLLVPAAMLFRRSRSALLWAVVAGFWGLCFGPLMYIPYFCILGGWRGYWAMWLAGIPFDLVHCASNFVGTLVLFRPLCSLLERIINQKRKG